MKKLTKCFCIAFLMIVFLASCNYMAQKLPVVEQDTLLSTAESIVSDEESKSFYKVEKNSIAGNWEQIDSNIFLNGVGEDDISNIYLLSGSKEDILFSLSLNADVIKRDLAMSVDKYLGRYNIAERKTDFIVEFDAPVTVLDAVLHKNSLYYVLSDPNYQSDSYIVYWKDIISGESKLIAEYDSQLYHYSPNIEVINDTVLILVQDEEKAVYQIVDFSDPENLVVIFEESTERKEVLDTLSFEGTNTKDIIFEEKVDDRGYFHCIRNLNENINLPVEDFVQSFALDNNGLWVSYIHEDTVDQDQGLLQQYSYLEFVNFKGQKHQISFPETYRLTSSGETVIGTTVDDKIVGLSSDENNNILSLMEISFPYENIRPLPSFKALDSNKFAVSFMIMDKGDTSFDIYLLEIDQAIHLN